MKASRFVATLLLAALFGAAAIAAFNVVVDPYLLFARPRVAGFNALKPAVETREALMKAYQASRVAPRTVILGSSRPDIGLDPAAAAWPAAMQPVHNLSLAGSALGRNLRYLKGLIAVRDGVDLPRTLVIGLDFETFLFRPEPPTGKGRAAAAPPRAGADPFDRSDVFDALVRARSRVLPPLLIVKDWVDASLTLDALLDSLATVAGNRGGDVLDLSPDGRLSEAQVERWTRSDGVAALFEQKNRATAARLGDVRFVLGDSPAGLMRGQPRLDELTSLARQHGMRVVLLVQPAHASHLELLDRLGYWAEFEAFKRALCAHAAAGRQAGLDFSVWDFGGYEAYAVEPVPARGDRSARLAWFWDPLHYTSKLGSLIITAVTTPGSGPAATQQLLPETIEARLSQVRQDRDDYRRAQAAPERKLP